MLSFVVGGWHLSTDTVCFGLPIHRYCIATAIIFTEDF